MVLPALLLAVCLADGEVRSPDGRPIAGVQVFDAVTQAMLGETSAAGGFSVEIPGTDREAVLEFRSPDHVTKVERLRCGDTLDVTMQSHTYEMEFVEVSATRLERPFESTPVRTDDMNWQSVADAAAALPSLSSAVQQLPGLGAIGRDGLTSAPTIRGFARDRSLILVEGMRIASDRGVGPTADFVDPFLIRDVVVIRGASGVAYGSGAFGGVVSVGLGSTGEGTSGSARLTSATNGNGRLLAGRGAGAAGQQWRVAVGGFLRTQSDYGFPTEDTLPVGSALNSGFQNVGATAVLERPARQGRVRVALIGATADDVGRPTTQPARLDTIEKSDHFLGTVRFLEDANERRTELGVGFHRPRTVNRTERFDSTGVRTRVGFIDNTSWDASAFGLVERPRETGSWLAGVDLFTRWSVAATETNVAYAGDQEQPAEVEELVTDGRRLDLGVFAGWKRPVRFVGSLLLAGRLDAAARNASGQPSASWVQPSVTAGVVYPIDSSWDLTGTLSRSFRAPRIQELYFEGERPGGARLANPELVPETAWSVEGGVRWSRGAWASEIAVWGMLAEDLIVQLPISAGSDTLQSVNETQGRYLGGELAVRWAPADGHARASLGYALMSGRSGDSDPLPDVPPGVLRVTGQLRILGDASGRSATVRSALRAGAAKTPVPAGQEEKWWSPVLGPTPIGGDEQGTAGFARWDLGLRVRAARFVVLDLFVSNLFDSLYLDRPESNAFPQPGRSAFFALTVGE